MTLFPREARFRSNPGGWFALSFVPTLATMVLGMLCGGLMKGTARRLRF